MLVAAYDACGLLNECLTLINSTNQELAADAMRIVSCMVCAIPDLSYEGKRAFIEFNYRERFQSGNFYMKQTVIVLLQQIIELFTQEEIMELFNEEFVSDLIDFLDIEKEKLNIYRLFGRLFVFCKEVDWIFEICDNYDFWDKVEDDNLNEINEEITEITADLIRLHDELPELLAHKVEIEEESDYSIEQKSLSDDDES